MLFENREPTIEAIQNSIAINAIPPSMILLCSLMECLNCKYKKEKQITATPNMEITMLFALVFWI